MLGNVGTSEGFLALKGVDPVTRAQVLMKKYQEVMPPEVKQASFLAETQTGTHLGAAGKSPVGKAINAIEKTPPAKAYKATTDALYKINQTMEDVQRQAAWLDSAKKLANTNLAAESKGVLSELGLQFFSQEELLKNINKFTPEMHEAVLNDVYKWMGQYNMMTPFERTTLKRFVPFWPWYRHVIKLATRLPIEHPKRTAILTGLASIANESNKKELQKELGITGGKIPEWMEAYIPVGVAGGKERLLSTRGINPANLLTQGSVLPMFNPVINTFLQQQTGRDWAGRKFTRPDVVEVKGKQYKIGAGDQLQEISKVTPPLPVLLARQIPQIAMIEDLLVPFSRHTGEGFGTDPKIFAKGKTIEKDRLLTILRPLGISLAEVDPAYARKQAIDLIKVEQALRRKLALLKAMQQQKAVKK